jgi:exonuclease VII small subunit
MTEKRPILGWCCTILGWTGLVLSLAALVYVWILGARINRVLSSGVDRMEVGLEQMIEVATDTRTGVALTRKVVRELETDVRAHLKQQVEAALTPSPETLAKWAELQGQLQSGIDQVNRWVEQADAAMIFLEQLVVSLEETGLFFQRTPDSFSRILDTLKSGREELAEAEGQVADIEQFITDLGQGKALKKERPEIGMLADRVDTSLVNLEQYAQTFEEAGAAVIDAADQVRVRVRNRILGFQLILGFFLAWTALAQWSLACQGGRWRKT